MYDRIDFSRLPPTKERTLVDYKNKHSREDIYVLGSGPSLNFINPGFFVGKRVIGVNQAYKYYNNCDYYVRKEGKFVKETIKESVGTRSRIFLSRYESGNYANPLNKEHPYQVIIFDHLDNGHTHIDTSVVGSDDKLVVSFSTITTAIHLAAYMGARNIILVGHDCGTIDGKHVVDGYYEGIQDTPWANWDDYKRWLKVIEAQTLTLKKKLKEVYGCNIFSLNPFVNFNLEGHVYR